MSALCRSISSGYKAKANLKQKPFEHALITTILARGGGGVRLGLGSLGEL